jgi:hypothetical protein
MYYLRFHGGDYEEYHLLGYKNPVRTSHETNYVSATEHTQLMLCKISSFTAVTMKNAVFWDVTPCVFLRSIYRLLVTANVPSSQILATLMEALGSSETSVLERVTRHNTQEDGILRNETSIYGGKFSLQGPI